MHSLRWRLTRTLLLALVPIWLLMGGVAYWSVLHELEEIDEQQLRDVARPLLELSAPELATVFEQDTDEHDVAAWLWGREGTLRYRSPEAPQAPELAWPARIAHQESESLVIRHDGHRYRVRWHQQSSGDWLVVLRAMEEHDELAVAMGVGLAAPMVVAAFLLLPVVAWGVWRGLSPLQQVSQEVARRREGDLAPIESGHAPKEVQPLLVELNALMSRLDTALRREQRFTADASHELRTPLAAVRAQVEAAQASGEADVRDQALRRALQGLSRAADLTEQLLLLSRLDHQLSLQDTRMAPGWASGLNLHDLVREVMSDLTAEALSHGVDLVLDPTPELVRVDGQPAWLSLACRNVIHNAIKFSAKGGEVQVSVGTSGPSAWVRVSDAGPGLDPAQRGLMGQRFARADHGVPGSGLGMSITRRVLDLHHGDWSFSEGPGLSVTLSLPSAAPSSR